MGGSDAVSGAPQVSLLQSVVVGGGPPPPPRLFRPDLWTGLSKDSGGGEAAHPITSRPSVIPHFATGDSAFL